MVQAYKGITNKLHAANAGSFSIDKEGNLTLFRAETNFESNGRVLEI